MGDSGSPHVVDYGAPRHQTGRDVDDGSKETSTMAPDDVKRVVIELRHYQASIIDGSRICGSSPSLAPDYRLLVDCQWRGRDGGAQCRGGRCVGAAAA